MEAHQERVVTEKTELDEKLAKLNEFGKGDVFPTLPQDEQDRLIRQSKIMDEYSMVLGERIEAFGETFQCEGCGGNFPLSQYNVDSAGVALCDECYKAAAEE